MKLDVRGFAEFLEFTDGYGTNVRVKESSRADKPHIWVFLKQDPAMFTRAVPGEAAMHLTRHQAKRLSAALLRACEEHYQVKPRR